MQQSPQKLDSNHIKIRQLIIDIERSSMPHDEIMDISAYHELKKLLSTEMSINIESLNLSHEQECMLLECLKSVESEQNQANSLEILPKELLLAITGAAFVMT